MANNIANVVVVSTDNAALANLNGTGDASYAIRDVADYIQRIGTGSVRGGAGYLVYSASAVAATGTITFSSIANNDTVTVNGRVYTAKTSGASGAQQFNIGGSDAAAALNLQAKINADTSTLIVGCVSASSSSSGVTLITCLVPGNLGNAVTIAISAHGSVSGSGLLTGGSQTAPLTLSQGL